MALLTLKIGRGSLKIHVLKHFILQIHACIAYVWTVYSTHITHKMYKLNDTGKVGVRAYI